MSYTEIFIFSIIQGICLGIIFAIFTFVINKIYVFKQLYLHKKRFPFEKVIFFNSASWQGTIAAPAIIWTCIGSAVLPLYQFPHIEYISIANQYSKHFFLLMFIPFYIDCILEMRYIYIFTTQKIIVKASDKFSFFIRCWINTRDILYKDIVSIEKYDIGVHIKLNNGEVLELRSYYPDKIYNKLQEILNNKEKEND